jgi:hypothetical protein
MRVNYSRAAVGVLVACATACGSLAEAPRDETGEVASARTSVELCELGEGSYGALLAYAGIDADGDGFTVPASGQLCTDGVLPPPYQAAEHGLDCDDGDPAVDHLVVRYPDQDGDGVGTTPRQLLCIGAAPPQGFASGGYDDDDGDPDVIETDDDDLVLDL